MDGWRVAVVNALFGHVDVFGDKAFSQCDQGVRHTATSPTSHVLPSAVNAHACQITPLHLSLNEILQVHSPSGTGLYWVNIQRYSLNRRYTALVSLSRPNSFMTPHLDLSVIDQAN